jgi:2-polyprenyl-3-methyl-5-hydroxy-6-metoxy-1,4-benzoquinol methylase
MNREQRIIESWRVNAANWIGIIDNNGIESRRLVTNQAIIDAVCKYRPLSVWDIGCGEGWLARVLGERGIEITGTDIVHEFIEAAGQKTEGDFFVASYEDIASGTFAFSKKFDAVVINFALIGKESTEQLLASIARYLNAGGMLLIQTLHPHNRKLINDYQTGWKEGSWDGLGDQFIMPYHWFFRTLEDWLNLLNQSGFRKVGYAEVVHPVSKNLLSVIFECQV